MKLTAEEMQALASMNVQQQQVVNRITNLLAATVRDLEIERLRNQSLLTPEHTSQDDRYILESELEHLLMLKAFLETAPKDGAITHETLRVVDFLGEDRGEMTKGEALHLAQIQQARFRAHGQAGLELTLVLLSDAPPVARIGNLKEVIA